MKTRIVILTILVFSIMAVAPFILCKKVEKKKVDHYVVYDFKRDKPFKMKLNYRGQFEKEVTNTPLLKLNKIDMLSVPSTKNDEAIFNENLHYLWYQVDPEWEAEKKPILRKIKVTNQFYPDSFIIFQTTYRRYFLNPADKFLRPETPQEDTINPGDPTKSVTFKNPHYVCYECVKFPEFEYPKIQSLKIMDQFNTDRLYLNEIPSLFCVPVDKILKDFDKEFYYRIKTDFDHLLFYKITENELGSLAKRISAEDQFLSRNEKHDLFTLDTLCYFGLPTNKIDFKIKKGGKWVDPEEN